MKDTKTEIVLEESERIFKNMYENLDSMIARQEKIEKNYQAIDGLLYFLEWKIQAKGD